MRRDLAEIVGADGFLTLVLSNLVILATAGCSWLWQLACVHRVARDATDTAPPTDLAMVLGYRLRRNEVTAEYASRLNRARALLATERVRRVLIVGGRTGGADTSEAEAGQRFLVARGAAPEAILLEQHSRHTLENLHHARTALNLNRVVFVLITSRYHLARSLALARGLDLRPVPCAAEPRLAYNVATAFKLAQEAYFLHWYHVGKTWSRWTGSSKSLARIS